ncbi:MAG: hypothetical protein DRO04_02320 [Candidatus Iainarchaeum archaeon]|uniref:Uncharacterized protein n=1 Tax=Candidatus Iainarchaeum sp. TaxID=3101447 RepID=A0A497JJK2_9ARCH|nr:MAG: hypothetical protein DRO04_02320 [Candidatus Diapherotrites archaeon]
MPLRRIFKRRRKEEKEQKRVISSAALGAEATLPTEVREGLRMIEEEKLEAIKREKRKAEKAKRIGKAIAKGGIVFVFSTIWNFIKGLFSASTAAIKAGKKAYRKP